MNDVLIAGLIVSILILIGGISPYLNEEFGTSYNAFGVTVGNQDIEGNYGFLESAFGIHPFFNVLTSVLFWTFAVPWWLNVFFLEILRIMLYFIVFRWIRGTG